MSIRYGRSLPKGPRPKPPQPKLGEVGPARDLIRIQRKRKKKKQAPKAQSSTSNGSQPPNTDAQQQAATKKKKKAKPERSKQNTPVRVEVVRPARASSPDGSNGLVRSNRVVVEWRTDGRRYLAWGRQGVKKVHGWRECTNNTTYQQLLRKLHPVGTRLNISDTRVPVVEILDLIIASGKILKPRPGTTVQPARPKPLASQQLQRRSRSGARPNQVTRQRRSAAAEAARNEVLVTRPSDGKPSKAARRRKATSEEAHRVHKRKQLLAQQRKELRRLSWLRRHGYEARQAPRDIMDVALQGGSPGLKR